MKVILISFHLRCISLHLIIRNPEHYARLKIISTSVTLCFSFFTCSLRDCSDVTDVAELKRSGACGGFKNDSVSTERVLVMSCCKTNAVSKQFGKTRKQKQNCYNKSNTNKRYNWGDNWDGSRTTIGKEFLRRSTLKDMSCTNPAKLHVLQNTSCEFVLQEDSKTVENVATRQSPSLIFDTILTIF